jgi:chemotaxis protein CheX
MSLKDFILDSINQSALQVFSTMLGVELPPGEFVEAAHAEDPPCEVVALIGVAGAWAGAGSISCSAEAACKVCAHMLMTEATSVNEEVLDAVAELTNMIIGNVKTELEAQVGPLGLSIPTVVFGRNFHTKTAGAPGWMILRFHWDTEILTVKLCLAPHNRVPHPTPHSMLERTAPILETAGALRD